MFKKLNKADVFIVLFVIAVLIIFYFLPDSQRESEAFDRGYDQGFEQGYDNGRNDGYEEGYRDGEEAGYEEGRDKAYDEGYEYGYDDGYDIGYDHGYGDALEDGYNADTSAADILAKYGLGPDGRPLPSSKTSAAHAQSETTLD